MSTQLQTSSVPKSPGFLYLEEASELGKRFLAQAQRAPDGSVFWLKPVRRAADDGKPARLGPHLHAGYAGAALFLSALGKVTGETEYRDVALRTLTPLRRQLAHLTGAPEAAARLQLRLGAVTGIGSFIYTFLRVASLLGEDQLFEEACNAATLITPEQIDGDRALDLMYGSAGALLALLLLEREAPEAWRDKARPLELALACGEHLLRQRVAEPDEPRAWPAHERPPCCGFAHGASGIAYALATLAERTGREDFWLAAQEGIAFERLHYSPEHANWWAVRSRKTPFLLNAWCNGAAGIALGRLSLPRGGDDPQIQEDLDLALKTASSTDDTDADFLCCGNLGRVDILLQASRKLGRKDLLQPAQELAGKVIESARGRPHGYRLNTEIDQFNPGFYVGLSGIGYTLLRLSGAADLPCVLVVE
jgi:type 2 lantibiotic biosynthesis protein LanM